MKARRRDHRAEWPPVPIEIGVNENGHEREHRHDSGDCHRRKTECQHRQRPHNPHDGIVDRMNAHGRQPIEIDRRMVDGMEATEPAPVKGAMHPIADEIADRQNGDGLDPKRQP